MKTLIALLSLFLLPLTQTQAAQSVYQSPADFVTQALGDQSKGQAKAKVFWFNAEQRQVIEEILAHDFRPLRTRYWQQGDDTVWILEEIGKEAPITVGIQVRHGRFIAPRCLSTARAAAMRSGTTSLPTNLNRRHSQKINSWTNI